MQAMENRRVAILNRIHELRYDGAPEDSQVVNGLKTEYNQVVETIYHETPGPLLDIIEVLPEDIWTRIIQESLPLNNYPAALLALTMVSTKWQQAIMATPFLWAHIQICGSDEDSLATIKTFACLSRNSPLLLTIYVPLDYEPEEFNGVLADMGDRLQHVIIACEQSRSDPQGNHISSGVKYLLGCPQYVQNLVQIEVEDTLVHKRRRMNIPLPPLLRRIRNWCFCDPENDLAQNALQSLHEMRTCMPMNKLVPTLEQMPQLRRLDTNKIIRILGERASPPSTFAAPYNLTAVVLQGHYQQVWLDFLVVIGSGLLDLDLTIPYAVCSNLEDFLRIPTKLSRLSVTLTDPAKEDEVAPPFSRAGSMSDHMIPTLKTLSLRNSPSNSPPPVGSQGYVIRLIDTFSILYKEVTDVDFDFHGSESLISTYVRYICSLPYLKRCSLLLPSCYQPRLDTEMELKTLESLRIDKGHLLQTLKAPKLQQLTLSGSIIPEQLVFGKVRSLHLSHNSVDVLSYQWPSLVSITICVTTSTEVAPPSLVSFKVYPHSFLFLTTLSVESSPDTAVATALCFHILCQQEACPSLRDLKFHRAGPEWDVLFVMLERRNLSTNRSISSIRRLVLPRIPSTLRKPLICLLRGLYATRPSNDELSFDAVKEVMFDPQIPGCCICRLNMLGVCKMPIFLFPMPFSEAGVYGRMIHSTVGRTPPNDADHKMIKWMVWRERSLESWILAAKDFQREYGRKLICGKQERSAPVTITEDDIL